MTVALPSFAMESIVDDQINSSLKRKRTPETEAHLQQVAPPPKNSKPNSHLTINYLVRQKSEDLPLISIEDPLLHPSQLLAEYLGVLDRHESFAFNLGARPIGEILFRKFERLFDEAPKILKNSGKDGTRVTWLDVVEFARHKPDQFVLTQASDGSRVCQFQTKQCKVQITDEDYMVISSGMPQKLIPAQPVVEDEEKELGTLEILENNLSDLTTLADKVAARARMIRHRISARRRAILDRRNTENNITISKGPASPSNVALVNGNSNGSSSLGFIAVNSTHNEQPLHLTGASEETKMDLLRQFSSIKNIKKSSEGYGSPSGLSSPAIASSLAQNLDYVNNSVGLKVTGAAQHSTTSSTATKDEGPYKAEVMARIELIAKGSRIVPPCDRCRRLNMECMKNLTACMGCTKKHAKCAWKDVRPEELANLGPLPSKDDAGSETSGAGPASMNGSRFEERHVRSASGSATGIEIAVANLAAVAQAVVETTDGQPPTAARSASLYDATQTNPPLQVQSPNIMQHHQPQTPLQHAHPTSHHQSPNIPPFSTFSTQSQHNASILNNVAGSPAMMTTSVNMPFASVVGRRMNTPPSTDDSVMMDMTPPSASGGNGGPETSPEKDHDSTNAGLNSNGSKPTAEQVLA